MSLFVDTSVWSLALRRDRLDESREVERLRRALVDQEEVFTTGVILQELLQGFNGPKAATAIIERFAALPLVVPTFDDHVRAAELRNACRRRGVQLGTIDALLASLCIRRELTILTTDRDFTHAARYIPLRLWDHSTELSVE